MGETKDQKSFRSTRSSWKNHGVSPEKGKKRLWWEWFVEK